MNLISKNNRTKIVISPSEKTSEINVLKILEIDSPTNSQIEQFYNEWEITKELDILGVRKSLGISLYEGKPTIKLKYIEGRTIRQIIDTNGFEINLFLKTAVKLTSILGEIHQEKIIHKDLNSENILIDSRKSKLYFSRADR